MTQALTCENIIARMFDGLEVAHCQIKHLHEERVDPHAGSSGPNLSIYAKVPTSRVKLLMPAGYVFFRQTHYERYVEHYGALEIGAGLEKDASFEITSGIFQKIKQYLLSEHNMTFVRDDETCVTVSCQRGSVGLHLVYGTNYSVIKIKAYKKNGKEL